MVLLYPFLIYSFPPFNPLKHDIISETDTELFVNNVPVDNAHSKYRKLGLGRVNHKVKDMRTISLCRFAKVLRV